MTAAEALAPPLLDVSGARVRFRSRQTQDGRVTWTRRAALDGLDLKLEAGEIVVLLGPNGAGKSTLVKAIAGRIVPQEGSVRVAGRDPAREPQARRLTGIVPQQIALYEKLTARENVVAFGRLMGVARRGIAARADETLDRVGLAERRNELVSRLSGGMRRRVNIAASLMHAPALLVLDEPTAGVDPAARAGLARLLRTLRDEGLGILLTTHDMEEAELLADRVAVMFAGKVRDAGTIADLVGRHFGAMHQIAITVAPHIAIDDGMRAELAGMGLAEEPGGRTFAGLVDSQRREVGELLAEAAAAGSAVEEVRLRRPGLDALMSRITAPQG